MNAVNLIPADSRRRRLAPSTSWPTLAVIGALLVVLAGAVLYVTAANRVKSRQAELAQVTSSVASWSRVAGSYQAFVKDEQQRSKQLADIKQLAAGRYPWEQMLSQISGLMPTKAALTSLQATNSGSAPGTTSATPPTTGTSTPQAPSVQLSGCAGSQSIVAQTMVALHRIEGVTAVTLATATDGTAGSSASGGGASSTQSGSGSCPFPVSFQMSLSFEAPTTAAPAGAPGTGSATTSSTTPATTGSGSTPTASAATNSTGVSAQ